MFISLLCLRAGVPGGGFNQARELLNTYFDELLKHSSLSKATRTGSTCAGKTVHMYFKTLHSKELVVLVLSFCLCFIYLCGN